MSKNNLDAIYRTIDSLPSLPAIVTDVLKVTAEPESSANDLMKAILPDQSMCATILKIANSAFFGLPREVSTIEKAVMVLGFDEIKNIVLGKAVFNSFKAVNGDNKIIVDAFWNHSFTCGLAAKAIAERINLSASELFIAGLIHDIGKLAMLLTFPNIYSHLLKLSEDYWLENYDKEYELLFINHDEVGYRTLNRWLFPHRLVNAVGFHHRPKEANNFNILASTIQIADIIAHISCNPDNCSSSDYLGLISSMHADIFDLWHSQNLPCSNSEIQIWLNMLKESQEKDTPILTIFSS